MGKRKRQSGQEPKQPRPSVAGPSEQQSVVSTDEGQPLSWWWFCVTALLVGVVHLSHPEVFKKNFTGLDDVIYIYPLQELSLAEYIPKWLLKRGSLAFPVRDASFGFDILISSWLGFQTATVTSVVLFAAYLGVLFQIFRRVLPPLGTLLLLIIVALHPIEVETIQWSISRKHLLVGLWVAWGVAVCLRMARISAERRDSSSSATRVNDRITAGVPSSKNVVPHFLLEWSVLVLCYLLSTLSHPTGIFFPFWVAGFLWHVKGVRRGGIVAYLCCAGLIGFSWTKFISSINPDYGSLADFSFGTFSPRVLLWENGVLGLGRAGWQLFVPISQSVHFQPEDPRNVIGFCLVVAVGVLVVSSASRYRTRASAASRKSRAVRASGGMNLSALVALLVCTSLPQLLFCIRRDDFAIADRLLFLPFPYLVATIFYLPSVRSLLAKRSALLLFSGSQNLTRPTQEGHQGIVPRVTLNAGVAALVVFYALVSYRATFLWDTTNKAVDHCAESADASRCWGYKVIEWREEGCNRLMQNSEQLIRRLSQEARAAHRIGPFMVDGFDAIATCQASLTTVGVSLRMAALKNLAEYGAPPTALAFAEMIINMSVGNLNAAHALVKERFVDTLPSNEDVTPTSLGRIVGALQVLCLTPEIRAEGCGDTVQQLFVRYGGNDIKEQSVESARRLALSALRFAKVEVAAPGGNRNRRKARPPRVGPTCGQRQGAEKQVLH